MSITRVNTNFDAIFASNAIKATERQLQTAMARISSGKRINYASDDPTGVGHLTQAKAMLSGTRQAEMNIQQDISMLQFADGVISGFEDKVIQMHDMALRAINDATLTTAQATALSNEFTGIRDTMASAKMNGIEWNGKALFGPAPKTVAYFQTGAQLTDTFALATVNDLVVNNTTQGGTAADFSASVITSQATAIVAEPVLMTALDNISTVRANIGSVMERLELTLEGQMNMETNYASALSTIGDADMASEISKMTTCQILAQSGAAMLGQANIQAQTLLNILM